MLGPAGKGYQGLFHEESIPEPVTHYGQTVGYRTESIRNIIRDTVLEEGSVKLGAWQSVLQT